MFVIGRSSDGTLTCQELIEIDRTKGRIECEKIGEKRGKEIGAVMGKIEAIKELHTDGIITASVLQEYEKKYQRQLTKLRKEYDQLL